jgi:hypothetical protein
MQHLYLSSVLMAVGDMVKGGAGSEQTGAGGGCVWDGGEGQTGGENE